MGAFVTVAEFDDPVEADYLRETLARNGIAAVLCPRGASRTAICYQELLVPKHQAAQAIEVLEGARAQYPSPVRSEAYRAARIALAGMVIPPLQLYSMWMVARIVRRRSPLSAIDRQYLVLAALLDLWLPLFVLMFCIL